VVHTLVDEELSVLMALRAREYGVAEIDLIGALLTQMTVRLEQAPAGKPGLYRQQREAYFKRVDAIAFTVAHDDGQRIDDLPLAEIVIVGPSRCGKTPLSVYLSVSGWKVANVPLVPGVEPPQALTQVDPARVVGLTIEPGQLVTHRQHRRSSLGIPEKAPYVNPQNIYEEVAAARAFCRRHGFRLVNVTDKPIESSAEEVIALVTRRVHRDEP
jgi:regulator of PEP synthase PpsR (kinase-PPPase family)